jgi:hypothetical protein
MAAQLKELILDEYKPIVLVTASPSANSALERNNLTFDKLFAPHSESALPSLPAGSVREGSPFLKLDGTLTVRFVDASSYTQSEAEAEVSLVQALTQHNQVGCYCSVAHAGSILCRHRNGSALHSAAAAKRRMRETSCTRATCPG